MILNTIKKIFTKDKSELIDLDFYKDIEIFKSLSTNELIVLSRYFITKQYKQEEMIFHEKHPHAVFFIVKSGKVREYKKFCSEEVTLRVLAPKNYFGEVGFFLELNRLTSAVALEDTELTIIKKTDFRQLVKLYPATGIKLLYNLGKSLSNDILEIKFSNFAKKENHFANSLR